MKIDELQKAIDEAAMAGVLMLRKSQMSFDFTAPNPHAPKPSASKYDRLADKAHKQSAAAEDAEKNGFSDTAHLHHAAALAHADAAKHAPTELKEFHTSAAHDHHVAYTRTNASGTVSNIAAKGAPTRKEQLGDTTQAIIGKRAINATELHKINGTHEGATGEYHKDGQIHEAVKHKGNWHLTGNYTSQPAAKEVKPNATDIKNHPQYTDSDYNYLKGKGYSDEEVKNFWDRDHASGNDPLVHKKAPPVTEVIGDPDFYKKQALLDGVHKVGNDLLNNPMLAEHHDNIRRKLEGLKANPDAKSAAQVAGDLKLIASKAASHRIGDTVHLGFGTKGGAGVVGKLLKMDDGMALVQNDEGRTFKGHFTKLSKP